MIDGDAARLALLKQRLHGLRAYDSKNAEDFYLNEVPWLVDALGIAQQERDDARRISADRKVLLEVSDQHAMLAYGRAERAESEVAEVRAALGQLEQRMRRYGRYVDSLTGMYLSDCADRLAAVIERGFSD